MAPARPADPPRTPTAVTSLNAMSRESTRLGVPARPMKTTRRPGSTRLTAQRGHVRRVRGVDDGVPRPVRKRVSGPSAGESERCGQAQLVRLPAEQVYVGPLRPPEHRGQQADRAGAEHQEPFAAREGRGRGPPGARCRQVRRGRRPDYRRCPAVVQRSNWYGDLLGQCAGQAVADAEFEPVLAYVVKAGATPAAVPAADHRVAGDPPPEPRIVHVGSDRGDDPGPLMTRTQRVGRHATAAGRHLAGEQLNVGTADAYPVDVDHDLPVGGDGRRHVPDLCVAWAGEDESTHGRH